MTRPPGITQADIQRIIRAARAVDKNAVVEFVVKGTPVRVRPADNTPLPSDKAPPKWGDAD